MMGAGGMGATVLPQQSASSRGLPTNPAQGVRRLQTSLNDIPPPPPIPQKFHSSLSTRSGGLSASPPLSAAQVISLAREAMNDALQHNESQAAEASAVSTELKPGVTIDLSRKNIQELPEEVVDIIKNELERLVASPTSGPLSRESRTNLLPRVKAGFVSQQAYILSYPVFRMHVPSVSQR